MLFGKSETVKIKVGGMHCMHCVGRVESAATALRGVKKAVASLESGELTVEFAAGKVSAEDIKEAIIKAGFTIDA